MVLNDLTIISKKKGGMTVKRYFVFSTVEDKPIILGRNVDEEVVKTNHKLFTSNLKYFHNL